MKLLLEDQLFLFKKWGWSSGVNVLGKLSVPGCPTNLDHGRARDSAFAVGAGGGGLDSFFSVIYHFSSFSGRRPDID